jgi:peptidoglycan/LPS O-acetylase OafA/YrhL
LSFGYLGVYAFFVLSGYLITPIIIKTKHHTSSFRKFLINFYGRRAFRIFPPYYLYLLIISIIILLLGFQSIPFYNAFFLQLPYAITYTYDFYHATKYFEHNSLLSHFWSLAVEEQFYIIWPLILFFLREKWLKSVFIIFIILGPVIRLVIGNIIDHNIFEFMTNQKDVGIYVLPVSHIDAFVIGGYFSMFIRKYTPSTRFLAIITTIIAVIGVLTSKIVTNKFHWLSLGYGPYMIDSLKYLWAYTIFGIFFSLILLRLNKRNFFPSLFENRALAYLGKISYGLYIYHFAILYWVENAIKSTSIFLNSESVLFKIVVAAISFALSTVASVISFEFFEKYTLEWKDKYFPKESSHK